MASSSARVTTSLNNNRSDSVSKWEGCALDNNDKTQVQKTTMPVDKNGTFNRCLWNMIHPWVSPFSLTEGKNSAWFKSNRGWYFRRLSSLSLWSQNFGFCWIIIQILRRVLLYLYLSLSDTMRKKTTRRPFPRSTTTTTDDKYQQFFKSLGHYDQTWVHWRFIVFTFPFVNLYALLWGSMNIWNQIC